MNPFNHGSESVALTIAGFDPSGGAGVLADIKTFEANGVYGLGVVTALTWQNDVEFDKVEWVSADKIIGQVEVLLRRFDVRHIKIGLVESPEVLQKIVRFLKTVIQEPVIVYDPIVSASAGFSFHKNNAEAFVDVMRGIDVITPNIPEAVFLFGAANLHESLMEYRQAFNIYLKGGHTNSQTALDVLYTMEGPYTFTNDILPNGAKHGSGCVLSSALTAQLAQGNDLASAAEIANRYTHQFLGSTETLLGHHQPLAAE